VLRIEEPDHINDPIYIWRLIDNKIHSPQHRRNDPFVVFQVGCSICNLTQNSSQNILCRRPGQLVCSLDHILLRTTVHAAPHAFHPFKSTHLRLLVGHVVAVQHHGSPVVVPGPNLAINVVSIKHGLSD
jgi:hypothetical protein